MSIVKKLWLLVGSALAGLALLALANQLQLLRVYHSTNFGNTHVVPGILLLDKAQLEFGHIRLWLYLHALSADAKAMKEFDAKIRKTQSTLDKALKDYEPLIVSDEDRKLLETERAALREYREGADRILEESQSFQKEVARELLVTYGPAADKLSAALVAHMAFNQRLGERTATDAIAARNTATAVGAGICLLMLLGLAGFGLTFARSVTRRLGLANCVAERIAGGDLGASPHHDASSDEVGHLLRSLEKMRGDLALTIEDIARSTQSVVGSANHLSAASQQVSVSIERQFRSTTAAASSVEELTTSIDQVGTSAEQANLHAREAGALSEESSQRVEAASGQIATVAGRVGHTAAQMQALSDQVQRIGNITVVIREVAEQTNLLALNAAIEAARAGEQGRGFAVVADEVRKLAERTTASVGEIAAVIGSIQDGTSAAEEGMNSSRLMVGEVVHVAGQASTSMREIRTAAETVHASIAAISGALREQRAASAELSRSVESILQMSEENASAVASVAETARGLVSISDALKNAVSRFRL